MKITIGTRGSALALQQAKAAALAIRAVAPDAEIETRKISTWGDRAPDQPLEEMGGKGAFTNELERALLSGEIDLCVHSMKDLPAELPNGCAIGAMLPRADAHDVLVCGPRIAGARSLADVPAGARLGTGSLRRTAQLRARHPHVEPLPIRGNVDTRLAKADGPDYEGIVCAAAGVLRLGHAERIACRLPVEEMVPAAGQGAIGIEIRAGDTRLETLCAQMDDPQTSACVHAERAILDALDGGCRAPLGAFARFEDGMLAFDATVLTPDGQHEARARYCGNDEPLAAADAIVRELQANAAFPWDTWREQRR